MRYLDIERISERTQRQITFEVQDESLKDDEDREAEELEGIEDKRNRLRQVEWKSIFYMARFTTEDDEGVTNFVDFHGFAALRAFRIREMEEFMLFAVSKFEGAFAVFAEILLIVVLIMTVFVGVC